MHDSALPVAAGIRSRWQGSVAPLGSKCAKFGRAPRAQELARGFGTGRPRSSHRLRSHSNKEFACYLPCSPTPWSASDPVFSPGRPSGQLGFANNRRIRPDFKRGIRPLRRGRRGERWTRTAAGCLKLAPSENADERDGRGSAQMNERVNERERFIHRFHRFRRFVAAVAPSRAANFAVFKSAKSVKSADHFPSASSAVSSRSSGFIRVHLRSLDGLRARV